MGPKSCKAPAKASGLLKLSLQGTRKNNGVDNAANPPRERMSREIPCGLMSLIGVSTAHLAQRRRSAGAGTLERGRLPFRVSGLATRLAMPRLRPDGGAIFPGLNRGFQESRYFC